MIEILIIGLLICLQVYLGIMLFFKIELYKAIFNLLPKMAQKLVTVDLYNEGNVHDILIEDDYEEDEPITEISYIKNTASNPVITNMVTSINTYLIKNKGASIDFHILKDIVDRNVEVIEDDINNRIPAPLYIGLAATMIGIIFGLFEINFDVTGENTSLALETLKPLIDGVKVAMAASVSGLIITTVFSIWIFKNAKSMVEYGKNDFLSMLQSELLPKMNKSKLPEVQTLATKLDAFSRNTTGVVSKLDGIVKNSTDAVFREQRLIREIKNLDVKKVAAVNIDVFNQLEGMMGSFQNFAKYYQKLDKSLVNTDSLVRNLEHFVSNTNNINVILEDIKSTINKSDVATEFFTKHIDSFSKYGDVVNESVASADSKMSKAIHQLGELVNEQFEAFNEAISGYDLKLTNAFNKSIENFTHSMDDQVRRTEEAFNLSRPKFEMLDKLDKLETIENRLLDFENTLNTTINSGNDGIIRALNTINNNFSPNNDEVIATDGFVNKKKLYLNYIVIGLKMAAYVVVISGGVYYIYINL